jgi:hypothetical protein
MKNYVPGLLSDMGHIPNLQPQDIDRISDMWPVFRPQIKYVARI